MRASTRVQGGWQLAVIKRQMNQNLDIFSSAIFKWRKFKKHLKGNLCGNLTIWAVKRSKKS